MKIVFWGTPQFAVPSLERLIAHPEIDVLAVVTQPDKRRGRGTELMPSPVKAIALQHSIPVWQPPRVKKDTETLELLRQTEADAFVVVAYGQLLSQEILDMPRFGCINGHGSLLPQYRGAAPIQWCLYDGATETGITTMLMDIGMDTGAMLLKAATPIGLFDTMLDLATRLAAITADLLIDTLLGLEQDEIQPIPQDDSQATYARLIQKADYELDWSRSAIALHNQIRGFHPNCFTTLRGQTLKVFGTIPFGVPLPVPLPQEWQSVAEQEAELIQAAIASSHAPGTVVGLLKPHGPLIKTGEGVLLLREVQLAGKRSQSGWDFANGTRLELGEAFAPNLVQ